MFTLQFTASSEINKKKTKQNKTEQNKEASSIVHLKSEFKQFQRMCSHRRQSSMRAGQTLTETLQIATVRNFLQR